MSVELTRSVLKSNRLNLVGGNTSNGFSFFLKTSRSSSFGSSFFLGASFLGYSFFYGFGVCYFCSVSLDVHQH